MRATFAERVDLEGEWGGDRTGVEPNILPVLHDGGILLDYPSADA